MIGFSGGFLLSFLLEVLADCRTWVERDVREEVAGRGGSVGDQSEDLRDEALLHAGILAGVSAESLVRKAIKMGNGWIRCRTYQLGIELREAWLTGVVKDEDGIDHDAVEGGVQPFSNNAISLCTLECGTIRSAEFHLHCRC